MQELVRFSEAEVAPDTSIRILGLYIDSKLRWGPHIAQVKARVATQARAIKCLAASIQEAIFIVYKRVYDAVVRPQIAFAASIQHNPVGTAGLKETHVRTLTTIQNDCLRLVLGVYKVIPTQVLEAEAATPPIDIYLDRLVIRHQALRGTHPLTTEGSRIIRRRLRGKRGRARQILTTLSQNKEAWALRELKAEN